MDIKTFWSKVDRTGDCWLYEGFLDREGYGLNSSQVDDCPSRRAHRIAWHVTNGEIPDGLQINHACDTRNCVNPEHLWVGTQQDNMRDMVEKGRSPNQTGQHNSCAKLTRKDVLEIRMITSSPAVQITDTALGTLYGVTRSNIGAIRSRRSWKHI